MRVTRACVCVCRRACACARVRGNILRAYVRVGIYVRACVRAKTRVDTEQGKPQEKIDVR